MPKIPGKIVYEEDQVLTENDLRLLIRSYLYNEQLYVERGHVAGASSCCIAHQVIEYLLYWLKEGKPTEKLEG